MRVDPWARSWLVRAIVGKDRGPLGKVPASVVQVRAMSRKAWTWSGQIRVDPWARSRQVWATPGQGPGNVVQWWLKLGHGPGKSWQVRCMVCQPRERIRKCG